MYIALMIYIWTFFQNNINTLINAGRRRRLCILEKNLDKINGKELSLNTNAFFQYYYIHYSHAFYHIEYVLESISVIFIYLLHAHSFSFFFDTGNTSYVGSKKKGLGQRFF